MRTAYLVRRTLRLATGVCRQERALNESLGALVGFNRLRCLDDRLRLEYDAGHLQIDTLLNALDEADVTLDQSYGNRLRLGWYRFSDANVRSNSRDAASTCCSQSPLRYR